MLQKISKKFNFVSSSVDTYKLKKNKKGFTLIELIIVIAIIGILIAAAMMNMGNSTENSRIARAKEDVRTISAAAILYMNDNPTSPAPTGCTELIGATTSGGKPYMTSCPKDPWGKDYKIESDGHVEVTSGADSTIVINSNDLSKTTTTPTTKKE